MNKFRLGIPIIFLLFFLLLAAPVSAETNNIELQETDEEFPTGQVLPDNVLYGIERSVEAVEKSMAEGPDKAEIGLTIAEKRLGEINAMIDIEKTEFIENLSTDYQTELDEINNITQELTDQEREEIEINISNAMNKHINGLETANQTINILMGELPEEAIPGLTNASQQITNALEKSNETRQNSLSHLEEVNPLKAAENRLNFSETRIDNITQLQQQNFETNVMDRADTYTYEMNRVMELINESKEQGINTTTLEERVANATLNHMETLDKVHEQVPVEAQEKIEKAMNASLTAHETALENLSPQAQQKIDDHIQQNHPNITDKIKDKV